MSPTTTPAPRCVLVVAPSWVGDATMATPAFRALARAWPNARRTLLCRPGIDAVLAGLPLFDEVIVDRLDGVRGLFRGARRIRTARPDLAILLPNSFRVALAVRLAGVPRRIGYARDGRGPLLTDRVPAPPPNQPASTLDYYCDLVERGLSIAVTDRRPQLAVTDSEHASAASVLAGLGRPYAVLVPGGNNPAKRWPPERFARVAEHLTRAHGLTVVAAGTPGESDIIESIRSASPIQILNLAAHSLGLGALKAVISGARIVVTNDTGPRHIAAAFAVPTVALFGPTDHRWTILRDVPERLLVAEPFLPEELVADRQKECCRIDRIAVGDVTDAIDSLLIRALAAQTPA
jgi:heptosyltransferase II